MQYFKKSIKKLKEDALSKGIYDILKYILGFLFLLILSKWIPKIEDLLILEYSFSAFEVLLALTLVILLCTLIVCLYFRKIIKKLQDTSHTDELTGLKNHKALEMSLTEKIEEYKIKHSSLSIIILDVDNFKDFNSKEGYIIADSI